MRKILGLLLSTVVAAGALVLPLSSAPAAQAASSAKLKVSPSKPMKGEVSTIYGSLPTQVVRTVEVQQRVGGQWKYGVSVNTAADGSFAIDGVTFRRSGSLRAYAPATTVDGTSYKAITSKVLKIKLTKKQTAKVSLPGKATVNTAVTAKAKFTPARESRPVELQVKSGSKWTTVATGAEGANGKVSLQFTPTQTGTFKYRVVATKWNNVKAATSKTVKLKVS